MMLNISVPFAHIFEMLKDLSETPMPILPAYEAPMRRETLPVILPQGLSERLNSFTLDDTIRASVCSTAIRFRKLLWMTFLSSTAQIRSIVSRNSPITCLIS